MAGPDLLCQHAADAIAAGDEPKFNKVLKHPRWSPEVPGVERVIVAALGSERALYWLQELEARGGVPMDSRYGNMSVVGRATEALKADVVTWLIDAGRPLPWADSSGAPLCLLMEGVQRKGSSDSLPSEEDLAAAEQIASAFYQRVEGFRELVGFNGAERLVCAGSSPGTERVWVALVQQGLDLLDPDEQTEEFFARLESVVSHYPVELRQFRAYVEVARIHQRDQVLAAALPSASVSAKAKPRF